MPAAKLSCSVIVPTYQRVYDLARCLGALDQQERQPDEVFVICRTTDLESRQYLGNLKVGYTLTVLTVEEPGQVAALNTALCRVQSDLVAITDDDTAPRRDWLARIEAHYIADSRLGGVGGRDFVHDCPDKSEATVVGRIQWFGRTIGRHHLGVGVPRDVEFLKGANMTFRITAIGPTRFDERLLGSGAQVYNDMAFSLAIRRRGFRLLYDPAVAVDHYPGVRFDEDGRRARTAKAVGDAAFNETLTLLEHLSPFRTTAFWIWAIALGKRDAPGLLQCFRLSPLKRKTWEDFSAVISGRFAAGARAYRR